MTGTRGAGTVNHDRARSAPRAKRELQISRGDGVDPTAGRAHAVNQKRCRRDVSHGLDEIFAARIPADDPRASTGQGLERVIRSDRRSLPAAREDCLHACAKAREVVRPNAPGCGHQICIDHASLHPHRRAPTRDAEVHRYTLSLSQLRSLAGSQIPSLALSSRPSPLTSATRWSPRCGGSTSQSSCSALQRSMQWTAP